MFAKHLVIGCLLFGSAYLSAMQPEASEGAMGTMHVGAVEPEVSGLMEASDARPMMSSGMMQDGTCPMMDSEQSASMKKKMASMDEEMTMGAGEAGIPSVDMSLDQDSMKEESQPDIREDKTDVQGVFESMSREEEDESFPG